MGEDLWNDEKFWREVLIEIFKEKLKGLDPQILEQFIETGENGDMIYQYLKQKEIEEYKKKNL